MPDYLRDIGKFGRGLAIVCLVVATVFFAAACLIAILFGLLGGPPARAGANPPGNMAIAALIMGILAAASAWMLVRILRRTRSANGVTMMPTWFIEYFGLLICGSSAIFAIDDRSPRMFLGAISIFKSMALVRRRIAAKRAAEEEPSDAED